MVIIRMLRNFLSLHMIGSKAVMDLFAERKIRGSHVARYQKEFAMHFDQIAIPVAERYQLALATNGNTMADKSVQLLRHKERYYNFF